MSPGTFTEWSEQFDSVIQLYYPVLDAYLIDKNDSVFGKDLNVLQNMLGYYLHSRVFLFQQSVSSEKIFL